MDVQSLGTGSLDRRPDLAYLLVSKQAAFARMWVEAGNCDTGRGDPHLLESIVGELDDVDDAVSLDAIDGLAQGAVCAYVCHPKVARCEHHRDLFRACAKGEETRVAVIRVAGQVERLFVDG